MLTALINLINLLSPNYLPYRAHRSYASVFIKLYVLL